MSVQTNYTVYIRKELVGNLYGLTYTNSDRESAMAAGLVSWGQGVKRGTGERKCIQGGVVGACCMVLQSDLSTVKKTPVQVMALSLISRAKKLLYCVKVLLQ